MIDGIQTVGVLGLLGATTVLNDPPKVNVILPRCMQSSRLLRAMADEKQTFYKDGRVSPWVGAFVGRRFHARH
jgi:hypothetical protein